ncbi:small ribosomal subunit biogenesis GTPase RsgA [Aliidiomarina soli]|uniref:Small ribosomal subunit biogenesis GTPase RsgA n=1 Tax=Aliidiomarina soli TaxID=1928574 RepID=A0A432WFR7_9GAMM|nr:small ribosomal subunit biogenesis GTPase RsgA [Aliidiomarina soli]RUO32603.1 ribosome biogenesis GTPase RsgA [Aliidiomarina soli]
MGRNNKLSKGQQRRVRSNMQKRLAKRETKQSVEWANDQLGSMQNAIVISRFGQHADIETDQGEILRCNIRRTAGSLVTGDIVAFRPAAESEQGLQGVIEAVEERRSLLTRPDVYDGIKPVAANIDQIFVVTSPLPAFSAQIIDRYLVACEDIAIRPVIVMNKADLIDEVNEDYIQNRLALYRDIGYQVAVVSAKEQHGLDQLTDLMANNVSVFVGQSGVGKSSLVNAILPQASIVTGDVSHNSGLGQHTTTVARLHRLPNHAALIDSPGIREFGLWHIEPERVTWGFREFRPYIGGCKFRDCKHRTDPGCALQAAVAEQKLDAERLQNYHRIIDSLEQA